MSALADFRARKDEFYRRGQDSPSAAGEEATQAKATALAQLSEQCPGDNEAGDDEEDVDAGESSREGEVGVEEHDEQDRQSA